MSTASRSPASLFDFGLYFFHNAQAAARSGTGPYFYLPKMESHLEARLWNDVFVSRRTLGVPHGTIRATVLIETILGRVRDGRDPLRAARPFGRPELRPLGLHLQLHQEVPQPSRFVLPDRARSRWTSTSCELYVDLLIRTCHRRGIHAMGGMARRSRSRTIPRRTRRAGKGPAGQTA